VLFFFFQAEDGIRDFHVTGVQTCALPIWPGRSGGRRRPVKDPPSVSSVDHLWSAVVRKANHGSSCCVCWGAGGLPGGIQPSGRRSEERRVGKEGGRRWSACR